MDYAPAIHALSRGHHKPIGLLCELTGLVLFFVPAVVNIEENNNNGASAKAKLLAPAEG